MRAVLLSALIGATLTAREAQASPLSDAATFGATAALTAQSVAERPHHRPPDYSRGAQRPAARPAAIPVRRVATRPPAPAPVVVVRPYHGVLVYGPRPATHVRYHTAAAPPPVRQRDLPTRRVERAQTFAIGLRGGSLISGYKGGPAFGDFGLGLLGRYRPVEMFGVEVLLDHHNEGWSKQTDRARTTAQLSGELFLWPWARVSPYVIAGITGSYRHADDTVALGDEARPLLFGPHGGVGLEVALGRSVALDFDARYAGFVNLADTDTRTLPGALQLGAGVVAHF